MLAMPLFHPLPRDCDTLRRSLGTTRGDITTAEGKWKEIRTALYQSVLDALGKKEHKNEDWFEENLEEMEPAVEAKRAAYLAHVNNTCPV
jgi:hypothetical protein